MAQSVTFTPSDAFQARMITAAGEVPLDEETQEPIMGVGVWTRKWLRDTVVNAVKQDEHRKRKALASASTVPVTDEDLQVE